MKLKLNLGSGNDYKEGYVNVDKYSPNADVKADLEVFPWPWEDNSVGEIVLRHVLEHLGQSTETYLNIWKEMHRVCCPNAKVIIDVPHPNHPDFLGDPTHCRPVTIESLYLLDRGYADKLIEWKSIGTPLAAYIDVDFVIIWSNVITDPNLNNIPHVLQMILQVKKPLKLAVMANGLGDICMGLGSVHALYDLGYRVTVTAQERFHDIISLCPQVYKVTETNREGEIWTCAWHQVQSRHQVDEIIAACGVDLTTVSNGSKSMDLVLPQDIKDAMARKYPGNNRIAIHNAGSIVNKQWPLAYWQELVDRFRADGIEVLSTGVRERLIGTNHEVFLLDGVTEAFDIPRIDSIALLNQCKVLISGDSGPIQLAGTTEIGIVGMFSIVKPEYRLPYRHGELGWNAVGISSPCPEMGCYHKMVYNTPFQWVPEIMGPIVEDPNRMSDLMYNWCLNEEDKFSCMKSITVDEVYNKSIELYRKQETR